MSTPARPTPISTSVAPAVASTRCMRERGRRAEDAARVAELVERGVPLTGAERELEQPGRRDREQREPEAEADALGGACPG